MVSEPLVPPSKVEWLWMVMPPMGMLDVPMLAFSLPSVVALAMTTAPALVAASTPAMVPALVAHAVEVGRGS